MVRTIEADVLVIGSGIAGCTCAIEANRRGANVVIIEKSLLGKSGASRCGRRFMVWQLPSVDAAGIPSISVSGLSGTSGLPVVEARLDPKKPVLSRFTDREKARVMGQYIGAASHGLWDIGLWLEDLGVQFRRYPDGSLWIEPTIGCQSPRFDVTGKLILDTLTAEIWRRNITVLEEHMAINILKNEGEAVGAIALDLIKDELVAIRAKATVLATGSIYIHRGQTIPDTLTGDGYAMALRAGAVLIDPYQQVWYNVYGNVKFTKEGGTKRWPESWRFSVAAWNLRPIMPYLPVIRNGKGEIILEKYKELFFPYTTIPKPDWPPVELLAKEIAEGRGTPSGCVLIDYTHIPRIKKLMKDGGLGGAGWWRYEYLEKMGIDPSKDMIEFAPTPHTINTAAIDFNARAETRVPGLYSISGNLATSVATGRIAAESASERAKSTETPTLDWSQVEEDEKRISSILEKTREKIPDGVLPATVKKMIRDAVSEYCYFWKNEKKLKEGLKEIQKIKEEVIPKMALESSSRAYNKGLQEYLEVNNILLFAEAFMEAALLKKESRGIFQRTDYPYEDPDEYTKNIYVEMVDGELQCRKATAPTLRTEELGKRR